jgi:nitrogen-specific signal transduction histidine kinase/ActR/RegA family two-component response regulator
MSPSPGPARQRDQHDADQRQEHARLELRIHQLERFEAIGRLAGGVAHDFNNALCVILGWTQLAYEELPEGSPVRKKLDMVRQQAQSAAGLTRQLLAFARRQVLLPRNLDLNDLVSQTVQLLLHALGKQIDVRLTLAPDLDVISVDASQIEQVLANLCLNARDAMPGQGGLNIVTKNVEVSEKFCRSQGYGTPGRYALLSVSDTGIGMDSATVEHIFEPFFTTKEIGRGTGLGLATVYGIVKQHDGVITVNSEIGKGTTFDVYFPVSTNSEPGAGPAPLTQQARLDTQVILVVDDSAAILEFTGAALESRGYRVILARSGTEAVNLLKDRSTEIEMVVLDINMPGMGGRETYSRMRALVPNLIAIFTTTHSAEAILLDAKLQEEGATYLQKPYDVDALHQAVRKRFGIEN